VIHYTHLQHLALHYQPQRPPEVSVMNTNGQENVAELRSTRLTIPVTEPFAFALASAAKRNDRSMNSYVRQAVRAALKADGFEVTEIR